MSKEIDELNAKLEADLELDKRKKAVQEKDLVIKEHRIGNEFNYIVKNQEEIKQAENVSFGSIKPETIEKYVLDSEEYLKAAKNAMPFINSDFNKIVPFFRNNLILIGSFTGGGKSTAVSNIVHELITTKNKVTGKPHRVLLLTNEEHVSDFYNRITCLIKGMAYTNHNLFTDEQREDFSKYIRILGKSGKLTVIGDTYEGISGWTTTPEGVAMVFDNLIKNNDIYDAVILDYYQNINTSKIDPKLAAWQVQEKFANEMDRIKLKYPGAIVIMAQMDKLQDEDDTTPYKIRINGRKSICEKATFICEIVPEVELLRSKWTVWKSRYVSSVGAIFYSGYNRGRLVEYSVDFQKNTAKLVEQNLERLKEQELGISSKEEENNGPKDS